MSEPERLYRELERSREARLRAWSALQAIREILAGAGVEVQKPAQKSFLREGEILSRALRKTLSERDAVLRELAEAARWVDKSSFGNDPNFPQAHQALLKALDRAAQYL